MISLKDYNLLYSDYFSNPHPHSNLSKAQSPFSYLYPSQTQPFSKHIFQNEKQEPFTITKLQNMQQCEILIEMIHSESQHIFSPSQQFLVVEHKNPNEEKRFLVISSAYAQNTLSKVAESHFFESSIVPSEQFCTYLIERVVEIHHQLEQKGLHLKVITPQHIVIFQNKIYLNYPLPHDIFVSNSLDLLEQLNKWQMFCAPQILKALSNFRKKQQSEIQNTSNMMVSKDTIEFLSPNNGKEFKRGILYSLGLCILYEFGFHVSLQDRYSGLKNPRSLNNYFDQLRKEVKTHHDGKYISKLLKLMLEHSESLRDTVSTFSYKMSSTQFKLLKKLIIKVEVALDNGEHIKTESQVNSQPCIYTTSGKKTIDIRISSFSNASSTINNSWLSISHQNQENKAVSPSEINKSLQEQKERERERTANSKKSIPTNELNEIVQIKEPQSPIQFDIQWDEQSSVYGSNKSSKKQQRSLSDKDRKERKLVLLNKISEKEECEDQPQVRQSNQIEENFITYTLPLQNDFIVEKCPYLNKASLKKQSNMIHVQRCTSKSEGGIKINHINESHEPDVSQTDHKLSETDNRIQKQLFRSQQQTQNIPSFSSIASDDIFHPKNNNVSQIKQQPNIRERQYKKRNQKVQEKQFKRCQIQQKTNLSQINVAKKQSKQKEDLREESIIDQPSQMALFDTQFHHETVQYSLNHLMNLQGGQNQQDHNESLIFEEQFSNDNEYVMEQKLLKQKKVLQKQKHAVRKKDQYNERSRIILVTLIAIYGVFQFIDWVVQSHQK